MPRRGTTQVSTQSTQLLNYSTTQLHGAEPASSAGAERLFSAASRAHHDLKGAMEDCSLEHELLALANID